MTQKPRERLETILVDGRTEPWPVNARLHPWSDVGAIQALADIPAEPIHLVGHSYGGTVALEAARALGSSNRR